MEAAGDIMASVGAGPHLEYQPHALAAVRIFPCNGVVPDGDFAPASQIFIDMPVDAEEPRVPRHAKPDGHILVLDTATAGGIVGLLGLGTHALRIRLQPLRLDAGDDFPVGTQVVRTRHRASCQRIPQRGCIHNVAEEEGERPFPPQHTHQCRAIPRGDIFTTDLGNKFNGIRRDLRRADEFAATKGQLPRPARRTPNNAKSHPSTLLVTWL